MEDWLASDLLSGLEKAMAGGFLIGLLFGSAAQISQFCLRSACIEFWRGKPSHKVVVWLLVFGSALFLVQLLVAFDMLSLTDVRQVAASGTLSGAVIGGALFGSGMILARGCASRLLVLSGTGNLRALVTGLVVTVIAQSSLSGILSPLRGGLSSLWVIGPNVRNLTNHLPSWGGLALGIIVLVAALVLQYRSKAPILVCITAILVGGAVALGWGFTYALSLVSFDTIPVGSITFTGPSADTLMVLISSPSLVPEFGLGLVPGVFLGSLLASSLNGEFRIQTFDAGKMRTKIVMKNSADCGSFILTDSNNLPRVFFKVCFEFFSATDDAVKAYKVPGFHLFLVCH